MSIRLQRHSSQDSVVHHPLHAVAITPIARAAQQISRQLHMGVTAARSLKAVVASREARIDPARSRRSQQLRPPPTPCPQTLGKQAGEAVLHKLPMVFPP